MEDTPVSAAAASHQPPTQTKRLCLQRGGRLEIPWAQCPYIWGPCVLHTFWHPESVQNQARLSKGPSGVPEDFRGPMADSRLPLTPAVHTLSWVKPRSFRKRRPTRWLLHRYTQPNSTARNGAVKGGGRQPEHSLYHRRPAGGSLATKQRTLPWEIDASRVRPTRPHKRAPRTNASRVRPTRPHKRAPRT